MYTISFFIVKNTKIAPRSLKKPWGRGKKLGSVGIPEHNLFLWPKVQGSINSYISNCQFYHDFFKCWDQ